jgi:cytoskeletal protein CcmA (bactofilin family)
MMLGSKPKQAPSGAALAGMSIIGADVTISGNLSATGDLHLDGTVEGDISCATLTLGATGRVKGHIAADKAQLAGQVEGTVAVRELAIESAARITGDLSYESVSIATGAHVDGRVSHRLPGDAANPLQLVAHTAA